MDSNLTIDHQPEADAPTISTSTSLTIIPRTSLPTILANDTADIFGKLAAEVMAFKPDASTEKGRAAIRSMAAKVASTKMDLIRLGKGLTEEWRLKTRAVNAECNTLEAKFDELKLIVRQALTDYENAERDRVAGHEAALLKIRDAGSVPAGATAAQITAALEAFDAWDIFDREWREFGQRANDAKIAARNSLRVALVDARDREAAAEAERIAGHEKALAAIPETAGYGEVETVADLHLRMRALRHPAPRDWQEFADRANAAYAAEIERTAALIAAAEEKAAEAQRIRDQEIADRAALRAREQAEALARAAADAAAARVEQERQEAARREREALAAAERAQREAAAAEQRRIAQAQQAEADRIAAAAQAERDRQAAVAAERMRAENEAAEARQRQEAEAEAQRQANEARAADLAHRKKINNEALRDICGAADLTTEVGQAVIAAIASGKVRHCQVSY